MKNRLIPFFLGIVIFACSSQPAPAWQQDGYTNMSNFINSYMSGNDKFTGSYYNRLVENLKMTTDPDKIIRAPLLKCAMNYALFEYSGCEEAEPYLLLLKEKENTVYYNFISGKEGPESAVPEKYKAVVKNSNQCDISKLNKAVKKIDEPLSRLIAASYAIKNDCYDESILLKAIETASEEGWKNAAKVYLEFAVKYYEKNNESEKADKTKKRIQFSGHGN